MIRRTAMVLALHGLMAGTALALTPGDIDSDGDMDLDDLGIWAANFTGSLPPGTGDRMYYHGDLDGDKDCDLDDQGIWSVNFTGSLAPGGLIAVAPEPAGVGLITGLGIAWGMRRRQR